MNETRIMTILLFITIILAIIYMITLPVETEVVTEKYTQQIMNYQIKNNTHMVIEPITYYCIRTANGEQIISKEKWEKINIGDSVIR